MSSSFLMYEENEENLEKKRHIVFARNCDHQLEKQLVCTKHLLFENSSRLLSYLWTRASKRSFYFCLKKLFLSATDRIVATVGPSQRRFAAVFLFTARGPKDDLKDVRARLLVCVCVLLCRFLLAAKYTPPPHIYKAVASAIF